MTIIEFNGMVASEQRSMRYLLGRCRSRDILRCPACSNLKLYIIEGGKRRRCARCGYSFPPFAGRWLNRVKISAREWLWMLKLFELEMPATTAAQEIGISYPTVLKVLGVIRSAIAEPAMSDTAYPTDMPPERTIFGVSRIKDNGTYLGAVPDDVVLLNINLTRGCIIFTEKTVEYPLLSCAGQTLEIIDLGRHYPHCRVYCSEKGFWPYAKERLLKHHGVSFDKLPLYIREIDFRWTNRHGNLFDAIIERLCDVPHGQVSEKPGALAQSR